MYGLTNKFGPVWHWPGIALIILSAAIIRVHLLGVPLERDEGEYAYAGQLILQGIPPYSLVYNMKMPGIYAAYALVMSVFGETHVAIRIGLLIINGATALLLFFLGKKMFNALVGITATAAFALLSMGQQVQGIFANAEHFVILPAVAGILLLVHAVDSNKRSTLLAGSVLLGLGFIMKQHGAAFIAFGGLYLFIDEFSHKPHDWKLLAMKCLVFLTGVILPFAATCLILLRVGVFDKFWFWTIDYASQYVSVIPFSSGIVHFKFQIGNIASSAIMIWIIAATGLTSVIWNKRSRKNALFTTLFVVFSLLAIFPGFYFRPHYFILLLPATALLAGIGVNSLYEIVSRKAKKPVLNTISALLVLIVLFHGAWQQKEFLFFMEPDEASRSTYGLNPFPESLEIASFIENNSDETDRIAVLGSEPQIYFYSNRRSATGYIYTYPLMESHPYALSMQREMIKEIESAKPRYLIFVNIGTSWLPQQNSERLIHNWINDYSNKYYELAGIVDIGDDETRYLWNDEIMGYRPQSPLFLLIFRRRN